MRIPEGTYKASGIRIADSALLKAIVSLWAFGAV